MRARILENEQSNVPVKRSKCSEVSLQPSVHVHCQAIVTKLASEMDECPHLKPKHRLMVQRWYTRMSYSLAADIALSHYPPLHSRVLVRALEEVVYKEPVFSETYIAIFHPSFRHSTNPLFLERSYHLFNHIMQFLSVVVAAILLCHGKTGL